MLFVLVPRLTHALVIDFVARTRSGRAIAPRVREAYISLRLLAAPARAGHPHRCSPCSSRGASSASRSG